MALGELTYWRRLGSFRYPQRHGLCCLSLLQHVFDGGDPPVIADKHGLSATGLQVAASATGVLERSTVATATTKAKSAKQENFFISALVSEK